MSKRERERQNFLSMCVGEKDIHSIVKHIPPSFLNSWKARRQRRVDTKKKREEKALEDAIEQNEKSLPEGGLVLSNTVFEPLKAMLYIYIYMMLVD